MDKISYKELKETLCAFGINPNSFWKIVGEERLVGWFPGLPERVETVEINKLIDIIMEK